MKATQLLAATIAAMVLTALAGCDDKQSKQEARKDDSKPTGTQVADSTGPRAASPTPATPASSPTAQEQFLKQTQDLIAAGGNMNARDELGTSPLHTAAVMGYSDAAELLAAKGADVNAPDENLGYTPLHWAAQSDNAAVAQLLISKGADVNAKDKVGKTPLHVAAASDAMAVTELLLSKGASVAAADSQGITPLHRAALADSAKAAEMLIVKGADVNAVNKRGQSPIHYARLSGHSDVVSILLKAGAKDSSKPSGVKARP